jgi:hypothetical protein
VRAEPVPARRIGIGIVVAAALLTSACAAGQKAATSVEKPTLDGTNADVGSLHLRGLVIEAPAGQTPYYRVGTDPVLRLVIVNSGEQSDRLVAISSPAVSDWGAFATSAAASAVKAAAASPSSSSSSSSGAPSTSTQLPTPTRSIPIAAGGRVSWGVPESKGALLLLHATKSLYPGTAVPITFTFANAGSVTTQVPVALSLSPHSSVIPASTSSGAAG